MMMTRSLRSAISRYGTAVQTGDGIDARAAVGEALWWATSAVEFLTTRIGHGVSGRVAYSTLAQTTPGAVLGGLVFLRNRAGHQFAQALAFTESSEQYPISIEVDGKPHTIGIALTAYRFRPYDRPPAEGYVFQPVDHLPANETYQERCDRDQMYAAHVAGRPVTEVLEVAAAALDRALKIELTDDDQRINATLGVNLVKVAG